MRRTDLVELLADVGLGGSMHSIVSQGKVDAVLASKPEDRRELVEEAAGLGKFKRRKHRAELKLARVATQVERARDVEEEVRKRLRPLALQATAAERAEKLAVEIASLRARIAQLDLAAVERAPATSAEERRDAVGDRAPTTQERLTALLEEREQAEDELSDAAGPRGRARCALPPAGRGGAAARCAASRGCWRWRAGSREDLGRGRARARPTQVRRDRAARSRPSRARAAAAARDDAASRQRAGSPSGPRPRSAGVAAADERPRVEARSRRGPATTALASAVGRTAASRAASTRRARERANRCAASRSARRGSGSSARPRARRDARRRR